LARSTSTPLHEQQVFAGQYGLAVLVENFQRLDHHAVVRLLVVALFLVSLIVTRTRRVSPMNTSLIAAGRKGVAGFPLSF
jgi:hypothetical protein